MHSVGGIAIERDVHQKIHALGGKVVQPERDNQKAEVPQAAFDNLGNSLSLQKLSNKDQH